MTACRQPSRVVTVRFSVLVFPLLFCLCAASSAAGQLLQRSVVFENARIMTMEGPVIEAGTLVVTGTKIRAVGGQVKPPLLAKKTDARGTTITPGLIDVGSLLGRSGEPATGGAGATRRAEDAFDQYDTANIAEALRHGVTAVFLSPVFVSPTGPAGLCGTGAVIRLTRESGEHGAAGTVLESEAALCIDLQSASKPVERLKVLQGVHKAFQDAQQYRLSMESYSEELAEYTRKLAEKGKKDDAKKVEPAKQRPSAAADAEPEKKSDAAKPPEQPGESAELKKPRRPARSLSNELLLRALDREIPVRVIADRSNDILNAIELATEFSLDLMLIGAAEAHLVADQIAEAEATVVLGRMDPPAMRRDDTQRRSIDRPGAVLSKAGVNWVVGGGASLAGQTRFIAMNAQMAVAHVEGRAPLQLITADAADALRVSEIGRLRPGSLADFVVWSGDPLDPATKVLRVFVGGQEVYSAAE